jgi:hypothetical protein
MAFYRRPIQTPGIVVEGRQRTSFLARVALGEWMLGVPAHPHDAITLEGHEDAAHRVADPAEARLLHPLPCHPAIIHQLTSWQDTAGARGRRRLGILGDETEGLRRARAAVDAVARGRGVSMAQIALAWVLAQPAVTSAIVGPSKLSQLDDNLLAADLALEPDELRDLGAATLPQPIYPSSMDRSMGFPEPGEPITG